VVSINSSFILKCAHHQLAIAVVFIVAGHMYRTNFGIGHNMKEILDAHRPPGGRLGAGHVGLKQLLILYICN
jgi:photosystem I P700 chlorophyll a apoprotein A2